MAAPEVFFENSEDQALLEACAGGPATAWECVERFFELAPKSPLGIAGHACFEPPPSVPRRPGHLVLSFAVHGNEWGTLPAALELLSALASSRLPIHGTVSLLLGNLEAIKRGVRFVEEDYNRVFVFDRSAQSLERKRAEEVRPLLDQADFLFDLHQTQTPTESAFWTFPWSRELEDWARIICAAPRALVRAPGGAFSPGQRCLDEYVRDRGKVGITAEFGEKGPDLRQARAALRACVRLIRAFDAIGLGLADREQLAAQAPAPAWYQTVEVVAPESPATRLRPGLHCFTHVEAGERLSAEGTPPLHASRAGYVLFPKYPAPGQPMPPEIYRLASELDEPQVHFEK